MATLKNTIINDTGYLQLPKGTTAQRPASPSLGMTRWNTTLTQAEVWDGSAWLAVSSNVPPTVEYLVVAGGGGGGGYIGGGGGAGGYRTATGLAVTSGTAYLVTIGSGGSGGTGGGSGTKGSDSVFYTITSTGG